MLSKETYDVLLDLLSQVHISPMDPQADIKWTRVRSAVRDLTEELKHGNPT